MTDSEPTPIFPDLFGIMSVTPHKNIRFAVVTLATPNIRQYADISARINQKYCDRYKLDFIQFTDVIDPSRHPSWNKLLAVKQVMDTNKYDYVMWVDADAVFLNHAMDVRSIVTCCPTAKFFIAYDSPACTHGEKRLCAGVWIMKVDDEMRRFLEVWYAAGGRLGYGTYLQDHPWEQKLLDIAFANVQSIEYAKLQHYFFNYYPTATHKYAGQFMLHVMGNSMELRCKFLSDTLNRLDELERKFAAIM